ncbi:MAG: tetratricopeptide repeat protein, partial [Roseicyclus sp.]
MTGAELLKRRPGDLGVRRALARYHMEIGQEAESLQHWQAIFDCDGSDIEAAYQLWRLAPHDRRIATLGDRQKATLSAARAAIDGETEEIDHVAICGVSYCGSTLLDRILGGLDGVGSIGESHWLTKYQTGRGEHRQLDLDTDIDGVKLVPCSVCGDNCEFLTHDFRLGMAADRRRWYHRIAARLGVTCLISSDKNYAKLLDNDPLLRFKCLVLFKSPEQAWRS